MKTGFTLVINYKRQLNSLCISELENHLFAIMLPLGHEARDRMIDTQKDRKKTKLIVFETVVRL